MRVESSYLWISYEIESDGNFGLFNEFNVEWLWIVHMILWNLLLIEKLIMSNGIFKLIKTNNKSLKAFFFELIITHLDHKLI